MKQAIDLSKNISIFTIHANQMNYLMNKEFNAERFNNLILSMNKAMTDIKSGMYGISDKDMISNQLAKYKNNLHRLDDKIGSYVIKSTGSTDHTTNYVMSRVLDKLDLQEHIGHVSSMIVEKSVSEKEIYLSLLRQKIKSMENE